MKKLSALGLAILLMAAQESLSQEVPEFPNPEKEHAWLEQFVGQWKTTSKGSMGPDETPFECSGTISSSMVGGFWVVNEMKSEMMGAPMHGVQTIGYDPAKKKYVGTWVDSMMNHLWIYEGTVDETGKKLTLEADGPNFLTGGTSKYRDAYEFQSADLIRITSSVQGADGEWVIFMTGDAKRTESTESQ